MEKNEAVEAKYMVRLSLSVMKDDSVIADDVVDLPENTVVPPHICDVPYLHSYHTTDRQMAIFPVISRSA